MEIGEIAQDPSQVSHFATMLSKVVCCRCVRMHLHEGKGKSHQGNGYIYILGNTTLSNEAFNPFPHLTNLQQTTLKTYWQKPEKSP